MEGLQISPSGKELLSEPAVIQACTPFEHDGNIKERLSCIPSTPSCFRALPLSPESEPGNSSLTITTKTTATDPTPKGSTAATPVLSLPEIFVVQKFYVSPSMQMDERIRVIWLQRIRARLDAVLFVSVQCRGSYVQEFMMVGKRQDNLKSALVIWCDNAAIKKKVWQTFKSQGWLQELLKANEIMFVALVSKAHLCAGPASKDNWTVELNQAYAVQLLLSRVTTSCGLSLLVSDTNKCCTLGGLLVVSGKIVGLTAGHPFPKLEQNLILPGVWKKHRLWKILAMEKAAQFAANLLSSMTMIAAKVTTQLLRLCRSTMTLMSPQLLLLSHWTCSMKSPHPSHRWSGTSLRPPFFQHPPQDRSRRLTLLCMTTTGHYSRCFHKL